MNYQSNNLLSLKKEALIAQDLNVLQQIRDFEKHAKIYFKTIDRADILDANGQPVKVSQSIFEILGGFQPMTDQQKPPGTLLKLIQERQESILIVEVGKDFEFPVTAGFSWVEYMTDQPVDSGIKREIHGVGFWAVEQTIFASAGDLTPEEIEEYSNQFLNNQFQL